MIYKLFGFVNSRQIDVVRYFPFWRTTFVIVSNRIHEILVRIPCGVVFPSWSDIFLCVCVCVFFFACLSINDD